jgi:hypothetical protein
MISTSEPKPLTQHSEWQRQAAFSGLGGRVGWTGQGEGDRCNEQWILKNINIGFLFILFVYLFRFVSQTGASVTAFILDNSVAAIMSIETGLDDLSQDNQLVSPRREPRREPDTEPSAPSAPQVAERAAGEAQHTGSSVPEHLGRNVFNLSNSFCKSEWESKTWNPPSLA